MRKTILTSILIAFNMLVFAQTEKAKLANEYYQQGEFEKAKVIYSDLENNREAIPLIYSNYVNMLIDEMEYARVEKFLNNALKHYATNFQYQVSLLRLYQISNQLDKKDKYFNKLEKEYGDNQFQLNMLAQNLANQQLLDDAIYFYKKSRKASNNTSSFALDLATIYRMKNDMESMTAEYLNYAESNPRNIGYVKNLFQNLIVEEEDQSYLEKTLISKIQKQPDVTLYAELLIWLELQRKNFYGAFVQARALDKRLGNPGDECVRIGRIAADNKSWDEAIEIYEYVITQYSDGRNYITAKSLYIQAKEFKVKGQYPINTTEIRNLAAEYRTLYHEMGPNPNTLDALRNKALLHAFYLNEKDSAINILNSIIENRRSPRNLISLSKLDLGDIYLLTEQPWESTLLYSQVEKSDKESPMGYEAKLRNAKLSYYTGNFALAKDHLDILKLATTREISNDAIALGVLIENNTVFDTTDQIMQQFANIEMMIFQNFKEQATQELKNMLEAYPRHTLTDEIYWILSKLALERAAFTESIEYLDKIISLYGHDILGDDAYYKKAIILADNLHEDQKALDELVEFLKKYPGSMYAAEARTRIRKLRGDYVN